MRTLPPIRDHSDLVGHARQEGIYRFEGSMLSENHSIRGLLERLGATRLKGGRGALNFVVELARE